MTFTIPWYYIAGALLLCAALAAYGWWLYRWEGWCSKVAAIGVLALLAGPVAIPILLSDELVVDNEALQWSGGFGFDRIARVIPLKGLRTVFVEHRIAPWDLKRRKYEFWVFRYQDGSLLDLRLPDIFETNKDEIRLYLMGRGIDFAGPLGSVQMAPLE